MSGKKKIVKIGVYGENNSYAEYEGRLLGLITSDEYSALTNRVGLPKKLSTVPTISLAEVARIDIDGKKYRLAVAITKKNDKDVIGRRLLVTEPLSYINYVNGPQDVAFHGAKDHYITVEEEDI